MFKSVLAGILFLFASTSLAMSASPDLVITNLYLDKDCQVVVEAKNVGGGPLPDEVWTGHAANAIDIFLSHDGRRWGGVAIRALDRERKTQKPGGEITWPSKLKITGTSKVSAVIDRAEQVREVTDRNNTLTKTLNCREGHKDTSKMEEPKQGQPTKAKPPPK